MMKKLIGILLFTILAFAGYSQNQTTDRSLTYDETYVWYTGKTTDVLTTGDSTWTYTVWKKTDTKAYCYVDMLLDSVSGTADTVWVYLQNKMFTDQDYTTIDSTLWDGADEAVISFSPSSPVYTFSPLGVDTISGTITYDTIYALTDTSGLSGYPADSTVINGIEAALSATVVPTVYSTLLTKSNQDDAGEYWRVYVLGTSDAFRVRIMRLNFKFLKQ